MSRNYILQEVRRVENRREEWRRDKKRKENVKMFL